MEWLCDSISDISILLHPSNFTLPYYKLSRYYVNFGFELYLINSFFLFPIDQFSFVTKLPTVLWFCRTYGFILTVKDLSPNIGVLW